MPNGELRFKLESRDGSAYVRTQSPRGGAWQNSHSHDHTVETYIVETGLMVLASWRDGRLDLRKFCPGQSTTIQPGVRHNVYLRDHTVTHTVKRGCHEQDWKEDIELDQLTKGLSRNMLDLLALPSQKSKLDPRFASYIELYNNLDNLIWQMPGFLMAAIGVLAAVLARTAVSAWGWCPLLLFAFLVSVVGIYCTARIRYHHCLAGAKLGDMDPSGYFGARCEVIRRWWPPSAHHAFMSLFGVLGLVALVAFVYILWFYHPPTTPIK